MTKFQQKTFKVSPPAKILGEKKCFKPDCVNEDIDCEKCYMIQGRYTLYKQANPVKASQI